MKKFSFFFISICMIASAIAQVAVKDEPRHHNIFENDYIRLLDVHLKPDDTTQVHIHATPSVFMMLSKTTTATQLVGQDWVTNTSVAGTMNYDSLPKPRIHRVWNKDTSWYHVIDAELLSTSSRVNEPILQNAVLLLLFDAPQARGYHITLNAGSQLQLPASKAGYMLVSTGNADVIINAHHRMMKEGQFYWVDNGYELSIKNNGMNTAVFNLLQMK